MCVVFAVVLQLYAAFLYAHPLYRDWIAVVFVWVFHNIHTKNALLTLFRLGLNTYAEYVVHILRISAQPVNIRTFRNTHACVRYPTHGLCCVVCNDNITMYDRISFASVPPNVICTYLVWPLLENGHMCATSFSRHFRGKCVVRSAHVRARASRGLCPPHVGHGAVCKDVLACTRKDSVKLPKVCTHTTHDTLCVAGAHRVRTFCAEKYVIR